MGPRWFLQMTLAWVPHVFRYGPVWDNMGPIWSAIMGPKLVLQMTLAWVPIMRIAGTNMWVPYGAHITNCPDQAHIDAMHIIGTNM